jgi:hypothetical protein
MRTIHFHCPVSQVGFVGDQVGLVGDCIAGLVTWSTLCLDGSTVSDLWPSGRGCSCLWSLENWTLRTLIALLAWLGDMVNPPLVASQCQFPFVAERERCGCLSSLDIWGLVWAQRLLLHFVLVVLASLGATLHTLLPCVALSFFARLSVSLELACLHGPLMLCLCVALP